MKLRTVATIQVGHGGVSNNFLKFFFFGLTINAAVAAHANTKITSCTIRTMMFILLEFRLMLRWMT